MVGFGKVAQVARRVGLNVDIKPTPSIALGAYEVMPIEIASAYTVFPNGGKVFSSSMIDSIRDRQGSSVWESHPQGKQVLDPRVTYLVEQMMEEVMRSGTAAGVHSRGFNLPAAGKTGTDRDGWFAGFTSKVICVVWVGFDDNRDLKLQGAQSALPIWVDFMKRAHQHSQYRNVHSFDPPEGIVTQEIDADTGEVATSRCPRVRSEVFIAGTQPVQLCHVHGGGAATQVAGWEPIQQQPVTESAPGNLNANPPVVARANNERHPRSIPITPSEQPQPEKKKGFWQRLKDALSH
jgi:penicillin-binding protein 1B